MWLRLWWCVCASLRYTSWTCRGNFCLDWVNQWHWASAWIRRLRPKVWSLVPQVIFTKKPNSAIAHLSSLKNTCSGEPSPRRFFLTSPGANLSNSFWHPPPLHTNLSTPAHSAAIVLIYIFGSPQWNVSLLTSKTMSFNYNRYSQYPT